MIFLFSLMKKETKNYSWVNIVFFVFMNLRFQRLKIKNLKTTSKRRSAPRAVRQKAHLAERCHSVFSLFLNVFYLRATEDCMFRNSIVKPLKFATDKWHSVSIFFIMILLFCLMKKVTKIIHTLLLFFLYSWPEPERRTDEIIFDFNAWKLKT